MQHSAHGTRFLWQPEDYWPSLPARLSVSPVAGDDREVKPVKFVYVTTPQVNPSISVLIHHYSTWTKLVNATAWMTRFKKHIMWKFPDKHKDRTHSSSCFLTEEETNAASLDLLRLAQQKAFNDVRSVLSDCDGLLNVTRQGSSLGKSIPNAPCKLRPMLVSGVLRVGGRLQDSPLSVDIQTPIYTPKEPPRDQADFSAVPFESWSLWHVGCACSDQGKVLDCTWTLHSAALPQNVEIVVCGKLKLAVKFGTTSQMSRHTWVSSVFLHRCQLLWANSGQG